MNKKKLFFNKKCGLIYMETVICTFVCLFLGMSILGTGFGNGNSYYEVTLAGKVVGSVKDPDLVEEAFLSARARISKETEGLVLSDVEYSMEQIPKIFGSTMDLEMLAEAIYQELAKDVVTAAQKAYTIKINEFTVTVDSYQEVVDVLRATKDKVDFNNEFDIRITSDAERELNVYTANIEKSQVVVEEEEETQPMMVELYHTHEGIAQYDVTRVVENVVTKTVTEEEIEEIEIEEIEELAETEETEEIKEVTEDGLREIYFSEKVEISEAYVEESEITPLEEAIDLVTKDKEKNQIYEVGSGDTLSVIANSNGLYVAEVLALNEGLTESTTLHIGDEIIITVPEPELSVISIEEATYEEDYFAEIEYVYNDEWYTTQEEVLQEPVAGYHEVTALITKQNGTEKSREIIAETVIVEPVVEIIEKGTQTPPTYVKPLSGGTYTSGFGWRWGSMHKGVDWSCPVGTAIMASCGGTVTQAGWFSSYGNCVTITHPDGRQTRYAHLSSVLVSVGQTVAQGEKIALSGNTGRSTGPHLHFEIIINGSQVDPLLYLE